MHPVVLAGVCLNLAVVALCLAVNAPLLDRSTVEDGPLEWLQFLVFTVLAGLLAFIAVERGLRERRLGLASLVIAGLAALVALAALEEVSWFQRVLGFETSEFFDRHNRQGETNLHNLVVFGVNVHKALLVKLIFLSALTHNLVLPLLARALPRLRATVERFGLYLPPLSAAVAYLLLVVVVEVALDHPRRGEVLEVLGAVHYLSTVFAAYMVGVGYSKPVFADGPSAARLSLLFVLLLLLLVLVAWLLSAATP